MFPTRFVRRATLGAALLALAPMLVQAQTNDPKEALRAAISGSLRPMLGESSATIVERVLRVKPEGSFARGFNLGKVTSAAFGRTAPTFAPDCRTTTTAAKEPDDGLCVVEAGNRESEAGAYTMLAFSKNLGAGDLMFSRRPAFDPKGDSLPPSAKLSDAQAYEAALKFLDVLGVPRSQIPVAPKGAKNPLPVRSLVAAAEDQRGGTRTEIVVHKMVQLPQAFAVPGGLISDPSGAVVLGHVIAPGLATLAVNDGGVQFARLDGWSDSPLDPKLDARLAKSTTELINEITDDLYGEGVRKVGTLSILIALRRAYPNPDDPDSPNCPRCGVLRPALQVAVSQPGADRAETSEKAFAAAGLVREYDLVGQTEQERPSR